MALDKQRILSELGSVMNQLQSADCGCMGKLFNPGQECAPMGNPLPTCGGCRRGCCRGHGYGAMGMGGGMGAGMGAGGGAEMGSSMGHGMGGGMGGCMGGCMGRGMGGGMGTGTGAGMGGGMGGGMGSGMGSGMGGGMGGDGMGGFGEPCPNGQPGMGRCNPAKLYSDTYNYLNPNLMQPIVQEVYSDLKSISPANSMGMNPLATKMGLSPQGNAGNAMMQGDMAGNAGNPMMEGNMGNMGGQNQMPGGGMSNQNAMQNVAGTAMTNQQQMGGMGSQILNMMTSGGKSKPVNMSGAGGQLKEPMLIDAPNSPHGQIGVTPLTSPMSGNPGQFGNMGMAQGDPNQGQYNSGNMGNMTNMQMPQTQYVTADNMYTANPAQGNSMTGSNMGQPIGRNMAQPIARGNMGQTMGDGNMSQPMSGNMGQSMAGNVPQNMNPQQPGYMNTNPASQQMANAPNPYGQHSQSVKKFNEMFPGVMQGDLGFDPMAIAIQMNPANQKKAAMDTIQKLMSGNKGGLDGNIMQPAVTGANAAAAQLTQPQQQQLAPGRLTSGQMVQGQQQMVNPPAGLGAQPQQQQVYTALTGSPGQNQQQMLQQQVPQGQEEYQQIDPNTGAVVTGYEGTRDPNAPAPTETAPPAQQMYKEHLLPADTSRNQYVGYVQAQPQRPIQYNTLGQPIEMLSDNYRTPELNLPQTLSPQREYLKLSAEQGRLGVKNTMSKTSLMGNRPVGKTPSRSQLQHIYQQYKGSQSYTQQNIKNQVNSNSEGRLNMASASAVPQRQIPVEKVGGDTIANNQPNEQIINNIEQVKGQGGDIPAYANKPQGDGVMDKVPPMRQANHRNGLQDMVYTSYPTSAAWSFHGDYNGPRPFSTLPGAFRTTRRR